MCVGNIPRWVLSVGGAEEAKSLTMSLATTESAGASPSTGPSSLSFSPEASEVITAGNTPARRSLLSFSSESSSSSSPPASSVSGCGLVPELIPRSKKKKRPPQPKEKRPPQHEGKKRPPQLVRSPALVLRVCSPDGGIARLRHRGCQLAPEPTAVAFSSVASSWSFSALRLLDDCFATLLRCCVLVRNTREARHGCVCLCVCVPSSRLFWTPVCSIPFGTTRRRRIEQQAFLSFYDCFEIAPHPPHTHEARHAIEESGAKIFNFWHQDWATGLPSYSSPL